MSANVSGVMDTPFVDTVFEPFEPSIGREVRAPSDIIPCLPWIGGQYGRVELPLIVEDLGDVLYQHKNVVRPIAPLMR